MSDYNDGKIYGWNGGECPVHPQSEVKVWCRGYTGPVSGVDATDHYWRHGNYDEDRDIIAFQVITPYAEPKVIWVNETVSGYVQAYLSEEAAKNNAQPYHTRIAVKYVEAKE